MKKLLILAPLAGLFYIGTWVVGLAVAYVAFRAIGWWVAKTYESPESYFFYGIAPFLLFSIGSLAWAVLDLEILPWLSRRRQKRRS